MARHHDIQRGLENRINQLALEKVRVFVYDSPFVDNNLNPRLLCVGPHIGVHHLTLKVLERLVRDKASKIDLGVGEKRPESPMKFCCNESLQANDGSKIRLIDLQMSQGLGEHVEHVADVAAAGFDLRVGCRQLL